MPDFIDIHSHLNCSDYDIDRDATIKRALDNKTWMINVGTDIETSKQALDIARQYEKGVYAIVGLHPTELGERFDKELYRKLLEDPKVVGLGECGLDYYRLDEDSKEKQKKAFIEQIELANEMGKPLMLHIRNAYKDAYEILNVHAKVKGNVHFFAGSWEEAQLFLGLGFTLSFTGVITFARDYDEVIKKIPLDMIMSETDCPYVTPTPYRGKRNEPAYVSEVVKKIAEIKGIPLETVKKAIISNVVRLFGLSIA